jgi:DNA-binding NarL/FixJ family response regulator
MIETQQRTGGQQRREPSPEHPPAPLRVLPCTASAAQRERLEKIMHAAVHPAEPTHKFSTCALTWLPFALPSTLAFRAAESAPDAIVIAAETFQLSVWNNAELMEHVFAHVPTLLLTGNPDAATRRRAARVGIHSVLSTGITPAHLLIALAALDAGFAVTLPEPGPPLRVPTFDGDFEGAAPREALTDREAEVLRLLASGRHNREIAAMLHISEHTAKFHVSSILAKLGARTRTEAVRFGINRGLVPI